MRRVRFALAVMALLYAATTLSVTILAVWLWHKAHPELTGGQLVAWIASKWWAWALALGQAALGLWLMSTPAWWWKVRCRLIWLLAGKDAAFMVNVMVDREGVHFDSARSTIIRCAVAVPLEARGQTTLEVVGCVFEDTITVRPAQGDPATAQFGGPGASQFDGPTETTLQEALLLVEDVLHPVMFEVGRRALLDKLLAAGLGDGRSADWWISRAQALGRDLGHLRDTSACGRCGHATPEPGAVCEFCGGT